MNRIYVASSWRNKIQQDVVAALREAGHEVYDFKNPSPDNHGFHWSEIDPEWKVWTPERYRNLLDHPVAKKGFKSDWEAMLWADTCVLVLPSGRSAHIEAGYFVGAHKRLVILLDAEGFEPELMYKMAGRICCSILEVTETLNLKQMNEPNPTTTAMADAAIWKERAEKAEAELERVQSFRDRSASIHARTRDKLQNAGVQLSHLAEINASLTNKLQIVLAREAEMRDALEDCKGWAQELIAYDHDFAERNQVSIATIAAALSSSAGAGYVRKEEYDRVKAQFDAVRQAVAKRDAAYGRKEHGTANIQLAFDVTAIVQSFELCEHAARATKQVEGLIFGGRTVRSEDVVPVLEAAATLAERAPKEPYPKEWNSDPCYVKHVPYCEIIALARAVEHAKAKGFA